MDHPRFVVDSPLPWLSIVNWRRDALCCADQVSQHGDDPFRRIRGRARARHQQYQQQRSVLPRCYLSALRPDRLNNPSEAFKREGCVSVGLALRVFYVMFTFCSILGGIVLFKEFHEHGRCVACVQSVNSSCAQSNADAMCDTWCTIQHDTWHTTCRRASRSRRCRHPWPGRLGGARPRLLQLLPFGGWC